MIGSLGKTDPHPLITVITPYYNNALTIFRTLDSLFAQTYDNIQYIMVDDGSETFDEDAIRAYIEAHKTAAIREYALLRNEENLGTVKALNKGLAVAKGEYIFSLAADDCFFDGEVLSDWVAEFLRTGADALTARRSFCDADLERELFCAPSKREIRWLRKLPPKKLLEKISGANIVFGACTAYSRKCYEVTGGKLDERFRLVEDHPLNMKLLHAGVPIRFFDRVVIRYRWGGISNFEHIDAAYLEEADRVFNLVALPLVEHKCRARFYYRSWRYKMRALQDGARLRKKLHANEKKGGKLCYLIAMTVRHPFYMIRKLFD